MHTHTLPYRKFFKTARHHWAPVMYKARFCLPPTGKLTEGKNCNLPLEQQHPQPEGMDPLLAISFGKTTVENSTDKKKWRNKKHMKSTTLWLLEAGRIDFSQGCEGKSLLYSPVKNNSSKYLHSGLKGETFHGIAQCDSRSLSKRLCNCASCAWLHSSDNRPLPRLRL